MYGSLCSLAILPPATDKNEAIAAALAVLSQNLLPHVPSDSPAFAAFQHAVELFKTQAPSANRPRSSPAPDLCSIDNAPVVNNLPKPVRTDAVQVPSRAKKGCTYQNTLPPFADVNPGTTPKTSEVQKFLKFPPS